MTTDDYQQHLDLIHDLVSQIDDLVKDKVALTLQLEDADIAIARLERKIVRLEGGQLELFGPVLNTREERQLDWQMNHQAYRRKTDSRVPKHH